MTEPAVTPLPLFPLAEAAATEFGLPNTFMFDLVAEKDDWSFVVKSHALLESMVTQALINHVRETQLHDALSYLNLRQKRRMLEAFEPNLFEKSDRRFMEALSNLRNRLVHNVRGVRFTFLDDLKTDDKRRTFEAEFTAPWPSGLKTGGAIELVRHTPRVIVWVSLCLVTEKTHGYRLRRRAATAPMTGLKQALVEALLRGTEGAGPTPESPGSE